MKTATAELTSSRTQMQRGKPLMVTGSCHLRIEPRGNITEHTSLNCFLLLTLTRKHGFPSSELLHTLKHFASKKTGHAKTFLSSVPVSVCSVYSPLRDVCVIHRSTDILMPCYISALCFCCCVCMLAHIFRSILGRQQHRLCVFVLFSGSLV